MSVHESVLLRSRALYEAGQEAEAWRVLADSGDNDFAKHALAWAEPDSAFGHLLAAIVARRQAAWRAAQEHLAAGWAKGGDAASRYRIALERAHDALQANCLDEAEHWLEACPNAEAASGDQVRAAFVAMVIAGARSDWGAWRGHLRRIADWPEGPPAVGMLQCYAAMENGAFELDFFDARQALKLFDGVLTSGRSDQPMVQAFAAFGAAVAAVHTGTGDAKAYLTRGQRVAWPEDAGWGELVAVRAMESQALHLIGDEAAAMRAFKQASNELVRGGRLDGGSSFWFSLFVANEARRSKDFDQARAYLSMAAQRQAAEPYQLAVAVATAWLDLARGDASAVGRRFSAWSEDGLDVFPALAVAARVARGLAARRAGKAAAAREALTHAAPLLAYRQGLAREVPELAAEWGAAFEACGQAAIAAWPQRALASEQGRSPAVFEIELVGAFTVRAGGRTIRRWPRRRICGLLALLAFHPEGLTADELAGRLCPHMGEAEASHQIRNAWSSCRRLLEPDLPARGASRYLVHVNGLYRLINFAVDWTWTLSQARAGAVPDPDVLDAVEPEWRTWMARA